MWILGFLIFVLFCQVGAGTLPEDGDKSLLLTMSGSSGRKFWPQRIAHAATWSALAFAFLDLIVKGLGMPSIPELIAVDEAKEGEEEEEVEVEEEESDSQEDGDEDGWAVSGWGEGYGWDVGSNEVLECCLWFKRFR